MVTETAERTIHVESSGKGDGSLSVRSPNGIDSSRLPPKRSDRVGAYWRAWLAANPPKAGNANEPAKPWTWRGPGEEREHGREARFRRKMRVFLHYGSDPPECACCGEGRLGFLTIDHEPPIKRRKSGDRTGSAEYSRLIREGYPKGVRVLCYNCNYGRRPTGVCPHKQPPLRVESQPSTPPA